MISPQAAPANAVDPENRPAPGAAASLTVLGIETSCDETAAAVVRLDADGTPHILSDIIRSQVDEHAAFGGVVPEIAARAHISVLDTIISAAMEEAGVSFNDIDAIAATAGPGRVLRVMRPSASPGSGGMSLP